MTKERPILFSGPMIKAILDGKKTQTRRVIKNLDLIQDTDPPAFRDAYGDWHPTVSRCPYGQPGDRLWVREKWGSADRYYQSHENDTASVVAYAADKQAIRWDAAASEAVPTWDIGQWNWDVMKWKPSIHMPRWASRLTLEVTSVRVERLQEITEEDARAEGMMVAAGHLYRPLGSKEPMQQYTHRQAFEALWDSINGARYPWESSPWVWVVEFKKG